MKFFTLDFAYPDAWNALPHSTPQEWFHQCFGTADFLDVALRAAGHEAETFMVNADPHWQVAVTNYNPDCLISTNIGLWGAYEGSPLAEFRRMNPKLKLVAFCSYKADEQTYLGWNCLFTSFPWLVDHVRSLGVRCEYLPLAFGRPVLDRIGELPKERDIPVAFVGGLGSRIWDKGTATMAAIAEAVPEFRWWGYKVGDLPVALERTFQGAAWGLDMYRILARTKILVNRHGEIARSWANNMRTFEGAGVGCYLLSDCDGAFSCNVYSSAEDAVDKINKVLGTWKHGGKHFAEASQATILEKHTYESRVPRFLSVIESLCS